MAMEDIVKNDEIPRIANSAADKGKWLALKEASAFLGVHFTTLRSWADRGDIPVFRTPGGHRRFSIDDLRRFLAERAGSYPSSDPNALVKTAVERVRVELRRVQPVPQRWQYPLDPATDLYWTLTQLQKVIPTKAYERQFTRLIQSAMIVVFFSFQNLGEEDRLPHRVLDAISSCPEIQWKG